MIKEITFKCLRCGHEWVGPYDKKVPVERACPKCSSNSQRPLTKKKSVQNPGREEAT